MTKIRGVGAYLMSDTAAGLDAMLILVESEDGLCGYGPGPGTEAARTAVETWIAPFLEGRALRDPDALRILFHQLPGVTREVSRVYDAVEMADHWLDLLRLELGVFVDNEPAVRLYQRFGFVIEGTLSGMRRIAAERYPF